MKQIIRAQYRAVIKGNMNELGEDVLQAAFRQCEACAGEKREQGLILTAVLCRWKQHLFLYMEYIAEEQPIQEIEKIPDQWFKCMGDLLEVWPVTEPASMESAEKRRWVYMYPVFWFDEPKSLEQWTRKEKPDRRCGRIAVLYPEKLFSYVCHHQAIVQEGLLVGDRYQMISQHENLLFSYFETPRDREQVNIRRMDKESEEIGKWEAVDPESHFYHFPEACGENFLVIPTVFSVG